MKTLIHVITQNVSIINTVLMTKGFLFSVVHKYCCTRNSIKNTFSYFQQFQFLLANSIFNKHFRGDDGNILTGATPLEGISDLRLNPGGALCIICVLGMCRLADINFLDFGIRDSLHFCNFGIWTVSLFTILVCWYEEWSPLLQFSCLKKGKLVQGWVYIFNQIGIRLGIFLILGWHVP